MNSELVNNQAAQVSLIQLLRHVPPNARAWYEHNSTCHQHIPYGKMCQEAADLIEKQDMLLGLYRSQTAEAIAILENGTKYEKMHLVGILNVAIKQEETDV